MAKTKLADRIAADLASLSLRSQGFWGRLTEEQRGELLEVRRLFQTGQLHISANALARTLVARCREEGIQVCGRDGMREWLARKD